MRTSREEEVQTKIGPNWLKRPRKSEDKEDHDHSMIMEIMCEEPGGIDEDLKHYHDSKMEEDLG